MSSSPCSVSGEYIESMVLHSHLAVTRHPETFCRGVFRRCLLESQDFYHHPEIMRTHPPTSVLLVEVTWGAVMQHSTSQTRKVFLEVEWQIGTPTLTQNEDLHFSDASEGWERNMDVYLHLATRRSAPTSPARAVSGKAN